MLGIRGLIVKLDDFFKQEDINVTINAVEQIDTIFKFSKDRKLIVPEYQREIRWSEREVTTLLSDITQGSKFIGNIILSTNKDNIIDYDIIDGQQRITCIYMILKYLYLNYKNQTNPTDLVDFKLASFEKFDELFNVDFDLDKFKNDLLKEEVIDSDKLYQIAQYKKVWDSIKNSGIIKESNARVFIKNLRESSINIITDTERSSNIAMQYYIDVNLKGIKLDSEDILKAYLFYYDNSTEIRTDWLRLKSNVIKFNGTRNISDPTKTGYYDIVKLVEHYTYCTLYERFPELSGLRYKTDLLTSNDIVYNEILHKKGTHLVKVIDDNQFFKEALTNINKILEFYCSVITLDANSLKKSFNLNTNQKKVIDSNKLKVFKNLFEKMIKDELIAPKVLHMKLTLRIIGIDCSKKFNEINFYNVYILTIFFTLFEVSKSGEVLYDIVNNENWEEEVVNKTLGYLDSSKLAVSKIKLNYKYFNDNDRTNYAFRAKSFATIYNYFNYDKGKKSFYIIKDKLDDLEKFLNDSTTYSFEHFVVPNSEKIYIKTKNGDEEVYKIEDLKDGLSKYSNSLFNFIYIHKDLNSDLDNKYITNKIKHIRVNNNIGLNCSYSKMCLEIIEDSKLFRLNTGFNGIDDLRIYFLSQFEKDFIKYANNIIDKFNEKINKVD